MSSDAVEAAEPDRPPYREPLFSLRNPARSVLTRFVAHLLIRLLIISTFPAPWQAASALFPVSMLWPLVAPLGVGEGGAAGGSSVEVQYDFDGRRIRKIGDFGVTGDGVRDYVYDQTAILAEYNTAGAQVARYDYGSDRLISLTHSTEGRRFYSFDALRSVTNLTDDSGATVASYHLDAWGNFRFPAELNQSQNRFAFTGYQWDQETGLYNAKARLYDPEIGRFITQDSYLGQIDDPPSLHRYFYANANPTRYVDPTGHLTEEQKRQVLGQIRRTTAPLKSADNFVKDAGLAAAGAAKGIGEVGAAPGVMLWNASGSAAYRATGSDAYLKQANAHQAMIEHVREKGIIGSTVEGVTSQIQRIDEALDRGDPFEAGAGLGNVSFQAYLATSGGRSGLTAAKGLAPKFGFRPGPQFAMAGAGAGGTVPGTVVAEALGGGGPGATAASQGVTLMANAASNQGATIQESSLGNGEPPQVGDNSLAAAKPTAQTQASTGAGQASPWATAVFLEEVARRAEGKVGGTGAVPGTLKHSYAEKLIERYQMRFGPVGGGLATEQSYLGGASLGRSVNLEGSVRLDVVEGPVTSPTAVYDFKFTVNPNPVLSPARLAKIRAEAGLDPSVPVNPTHP